MPPIAAAHAPTVTEEDQAGGKVPHEEAQHRTCRDERRGEDEAVTDLKRHVGQRQHHHQHAHRGQAVEAVDDVVTGASLTCAITTPETMASMTPKPPTRGTTRA